MVIASRTRSRPMNCSEDWLGNSPRTRTLKKLLASPKSVAHWENCVLLVIWHERESTRRVSQRWRWP